MTVQQPHTANLTPHPALVAPLADPEVAEVGLSGLVSVIARCRQTTESTHTIADFEAERL